MADLIVRQIDRLEGIDGLAGKRLVVDDTKRLIGQIDGQRRQNTEVGRQLSDRALLIEYDSGDILEIGIVENGGGDLGRRTRSVDTIDCSSFTASVECKYTGASRGCLS